MAETVSRNAELAGSSLMDESEQSSTARIAAEEQCLGGLLQLIDEFTRTPEIARA